MVEQEIFIKAVQKAGLHDSFTKIPPVLYGEFIFSHLFAKAFWGEEIILTGIWLDNDEEQEMIAWKFHLQQMVLEEEPVKYLERFL